MSVPWNAVKDYVCHSANDADSVSTGKMSTPFILSVISEI